MDQYLTGALWLKSTACVDGDSCVEVTRVGRWIGVRDSTDTDKGSVLVLGHHHWRTFIARIRAGDFNP
jgi:hypothetical protein